MARRRPRNSLGWIIVAVAGFFALSEDASFYVVAVVVTVGAIAGHRTGVDSGGNLLLFDHPAGWALWWWVVNDLFFPLLALGWLVSVAVRPLGVRADPGRGGVRRDAGYPGQSRRGHLEVPAVRHDRIISPEAYAIISGLLVRVYAGLVLLATQVLRLHGTVAVAAATLAAAALFSPVRRRVQRAVDRRFNRARYDADQTIAAFAGRLKDGVDLDAVREDLAGVAQAALEPAHVSVWIRPG